jgi:hypothetical protein
MKRCFYGGKGPNGDKAPGLDGFSMAFFQASWDVIKTCIMGVFHDFHACSRFERSLNATSLLSSRRNLGAIDLKDFRPVSLLSGIYKIIAKVLTNRSRRVVEKSSSKSQYAFVKGRQILNSMLIVNECLDSKIRSSEPRMLCKLDIENAYDHVNWESLLYLLRSVASPSW